MNPFKPYSGALHLTVILIVLLQIFRSSAAYDPIYWQYYFPVKVQSTIIFVE